MPSTSAVVKLVRQFKRDLFRRDAEQMILMAREWVKIENALNGLIEDLILDINRRVELGLGVSRGKILKLERYQQLMKQATAEFARYAEYTTGLVLSGQTEIISIALSDTARILQAAILESNIVSYSSFNTININAVEFMIGHTSAGTPLADLILERVAFDAEMQLRVIDTLNKATALGYNPRKTAQLIKGDLAGGLNKAMQITRTEQLRVYRETSRLQYEASEVVSGYKRMAGKKSACAACLLADGTFYQTYIEFQEHPQGRCGMIPVVIGAKEPTWETGKEWFLKQSPEKQASILGHGKYEAWKDGKFELDAVVTTKTNDTWGTSLVPTPLKDLVNG